MGSTFSVPGVGGGVTLPPTILYSSDGTPRTVGANSSARASMLPSAAGGTSVTVKAGKLPIGGALHLKGFGLISAANVAPGTFTFTPTVTPVGGAKTDLGGLSVTPLIGVQGVCGIDLLFIQTPSGLLTGGAVDYGVQNANPYRLNINTAATIVASDPSVDRTFGVDGQWAVASASNYVTAQSVVIALLQPGG